MLEAINFLILIWILKRFLYKPVLEVISNRKAVIEKSKTDAESLFNDAEKLQQRYQNRLVEWDKELQAARHSLTLEIEAERANKTISFKKDLEKERQKVKASEANRLANERQQIEATAMAHAAKFAASLLKHVACQDVEFRLVELVINQLSNLPSEQVDLVRNSSGQLPDEILVVSAYPLADDQRLQFKQALRDLLSLNIPVRFEQDVDLLAGARIGVGDWILGINIQDELKGMNELAFGE